MKQVVVFLDKTARIVTNPENLDEYENNPKAVVNPDLMAVHGVAPHFWKLEHGRVVPMSEPEKAERLKELEYDRDNTYSINTMFLRVSHLQNNIDDLNKEITRLNDELIDKAKSHEVSLANLEKSLKDEHEEKLTKLEQEWTSYSYDKRIRHVEEMNKTKEELRARYYRMMIVASGLAALLTFSITKLIH